MARRSGCASTPGAAQRSRSRQIPPCARIWEPPAPPMRVCLVYDCLFPHTVGGAERWYRSLAERLAADGHQVTYLTLRQWDRGVDPAWSRASTCGPSARGWRSTPAPAAGASCRRSCSAPACSGTCCVTAGATTPSTRARSRTSRCSPRPLVAAAGRYRLVVDWHEVWTRGYWREYLGPARPARRMARPAAVRAGPAAGVLLLAPVRAAAARRGPARRDHVLAGAYDGPLEPRPSAPPSRSCVFAGPPHPREARPGDPARDRARARRGSRSCAPRSSATAPSATRRAARVARARARGRRSRSPGSWPPSASRTPSRARCACCCPRGARATGWWSSRRPPAAPRASSSPGPTTRPSSCRGGRQRVRRAVGVAGGPGRGDRPGPRGRRRRCASRRPSGSSATSSRLSLDRRWRSCSPSTAASARS